MGNFTQLTMGTSKGKVNNICYFNIFPIYYSLSLTKAKGKKKEMSHTDRQKTYPSPNRRPNLINAFCILWKKEEKKQTNNPKTPFKTRISLPCFYRISCQKNCIIPSFLIKKLNWKWYFCGNKKPTILLWQSLKRT